MPYFKSAMNIHSPKCFMLYSACDTNVAKHPWDKTQGMLTKEISMQTTAFVTNSSRKEFTQEKMSSDLKVRN